jgi:hypothetical protein
VAFRNSQKKELVERVKAVLASRRLTLYQVSEETRRLYGRSSAYFLPHNLYYDLGLGTFSPSLHQIFALSKVSGYRLNDWLCVFGFDPEDIVRLQVLLPSKRTTLLDSALEDPESWIPWFRNKPGDSWVPAIAPIGRSVDLAPPKRIRSLQQGTTNDFVYAKIGREDAFAFPDLLPGSIVRADVRRGKSLLLAASGKGSNPMFLIEHANGVCSCRLQTAGKSRIRPLSTDLPYAQVELEIPGEARILGVLDLEIRSLIKPEQPDVPKALARHWRPLRLASQGSKLSELLRHGRLKAGLSFREASAMSRRVASELGDKQYFAAPGSLSDYEAIDTPPRHIHKAITLCAVYGLCFSTFLKSIGLHMEEAGNQPIADRLVIREYPSERGGAGRDVLTANGVFKQLLNRSEQIPFFLRRSVPVLSGLRIPSLHDFFWIGEEQSALHPLLVNGLIAIVNRHRKKPFHFRSRPLWQQPIYVLLKRDGTYICGCCSLESGTLMIHPYSPSDQPPEHLRNHHDAEVVGQVVTIARKI